MKNRDILFWSDNTATLLAISSLASINIAPFLDFPMRLLMLCLICIGLISADPLGQPFLPSLGTWWRSYDGAA